MKKEENPGPMNPSGFISRSGICYLLSAILLLFIILVNPVSGSVWPDPGDWPVWGSQAADITPASWPAEGDWHSYTAKGSALADPAVADPSNGGTSPQNYVSVTSNCPDKTLPSVYWYFNPVKQVLYFRFRLSAIPCTYATGPSAGAAATTDPWRSAQWSVLIDIDGDGYREFAMQLDGSTGGPSTPVDRLSIIYSANQSNSLDYATIGSGIYLVNQFPTAFVNASGGSILNFHNTNTPNTTWANGSAETVWDYGMTRCRNVTVGGCTEYITDYQIPLSMLDATGVGGPALTQNTSMSFLFATANSLQNPFQKDVVTLGDLVYIGDPVKPAPYGDTITPAGGDSLPQPIVASVTVSGCHPATLTATVNDAVDIVAGNAVTTVSSVQFYYYADADGDGLANDGSTWTLIGAGSTTNNPIGTWTASWESTSLAQGRYLIGAKATDGQGNVTWSWMDPADIGSIGSTPPNYANPTNTGQIFTLFTNTCGAPPSYAVVTSDASAPVLPGAAVTFTVTVTNTSGAPITVSSITDTLPAGFTYQSTGGGTLGAPSGTPGVGDSGAITWTFPPASIPAGASRTLIFTANASNTAGTYTDTASAVTSVGTLDTDPTPVSVGSPQLSLNMSVSAASVSPGGTLTYTITYANTSPVNITGAVISNPLPDGVTYDSNTGGGTYTAGTQTVSWSIGDLAAGESGSVTVTVNVDDPFPSDATIPVVNTATLESNEALTASASASAYVSAPRPTLSLQKSATSATIAENNNVTFTISYFNTGNATATSLTLTDAVPSGLSFVSATGGGTHNAGTVTWNLADLAANASGSVTVTLHVPAGYAGDNPIVNTASISASGVDSVTNSFWLGVNQTDNQCNTYYFSNTTEDMGVDGVQYLATTTAPTGAGTNLHATLPSFPATPVPFTEITRFYSPTTANAIDFSGNLTTTYWVDRANGNALDVKVTVYDYDSTTGAKTQLGTNTVALGGSSKGMQSFTVALSGALSKSHRLLWVIEGAEQQKNKTDDIYFQFGGTVTNPISGGTVSATSNGAVCFTPPANLVIDKQVNVLNANPGDTLTYTILFSNTGQTAASGAQVTDTLPTGVTYASATLNGGAVAPASQVGQAVTFNVNSSDTGIAGRVSGGQSGSLVITATIDNPLDSGITTLTNTAALVSNETATVSDTATTSVLRPAVTVIQSATPSLVEPNDPVTYTLTVINSGTSSATNVTLNDVLPVQAYYTYVPGSTTLNGGAVADHVAGGTLNYNIGTLDAGETAVVTLQMKAGAAGSFPATQTNLSNTATVSDSQTVGSRSSNTVAVTINPLPNLSITNSFSPGGPYTAGDIITCEITVTNTGGSDALGVVVIEGIPAYTTYVPGSLVVEAASKTDVSGDDTANFDSAGNRTVFRIGTVPSGATRTMSFQVRVQGSMPSGSTTLTGTAEVSASNAASKSLTDTGVVAAEPTLSVSKIGPANSPYPAAAVTATSAGTTVSVDDVSPFVVNQYIRVAGQNRQITAISGSTLTIDSAANVTDGDSVTGSLTYTLQYSNTGSADAAGATLVDTLPGGAIYVSSTGGGVYAPGPGTVTWTIGSLPVNASGLVQVILFPGAAGSLTNSAAISATAVNPLSASVTTGVGGLHIRKHTTTPSVGQGGTAVYVIEVENTHSATATGVVVTDTLPSGFTYSSTASITGGTRTATNDPSSGDQAPSWGTFSIASGDTLTITFNAAIAAGIAGTFDNELSVTSTNTSVGTFDPLLTTAEDVAVSEAVIPAPSGSLSNSTGAISVGCSASLSWTAANATSGTLNPGNIAVTVGNGSGSISVTPSETTAYTLSLSGPGGTVSYNATVTVNAAPAITAFSASPSTIAAGASVTFSATFTGGTGVITPGNYAIVSGGTYVLATGPSESTAYTLTVTAPCGAASQQTASTTVTVGDAPSGSLTNSTGAISVGCSAVLNWTAANATSGTLNPGNIAVTVGNGSGSISVTPSETTTYTLSLTGSGGTTTYNATVTVNAAPAITAFSASPSTITAGQSVTFSATFTGGTGVITPGNYAIVSGGTYVLATGPSESTAYTLTVTAPCGAASQHTASTTVAVGDAPSGSLTNSTGAISVGCSAVLNWTASNATSGTLTPGNITVPVGNGSGSVTVTPSETTTYTLSLTGSGGTTTYNATVTVNAAPAITLFSVSPSTITAGQSVTFSATFTGGTGVITPGGYSISSGDTYVLATGPSSTTTYTLTVTAACGSASQATETATVSIPGNNRLKALKSATDINGGNLMPGDDILYTISIINSTNNDVNGVEFSDAIPENTDYVDGSAAAPAGSLIALTNNTLDVSDIQVPARSQVSVTFRVRVRNPLNSGVTSISNQGTIRYDKNGDGQNDTQALTDGDTVVSGEQPSALPIRLGPNMNDTLKTVTLVGDQNQDGVASPGDTVRYRIDITNSGDLNANGAVFRDTVPGDLDAVATSVTATSGSVVYHASIRQIEWTGTLPAGGSLRLTFDAVIHTGILPKTLISNQGTLEYDSNNDGVNDTQRLTDGDVNLPGQQPTDFIVGGISAIPVTKTAIPVNCVTPGPGDELQYEITISNPTGYLLPGVEVIDPTPANTTFVVGSTSAPAGSVIVSETPTLRVTGISIPPFSQVKITFHVRINTVLGPNVDKIINQGTVNFDSDGDSLNDGSTLTDWTPGTPGNQPTDIVIACPAMEVSIRSLESTVKCDEEIEYLIEYTNHSALTARNISIRASYDYKVAFHSSDPEPDPGTEDTWTIGTVEPSQTGSIRLKVSVLYRMPFLQIVPMSVILTSSCDSRFAETRTHVIECGPR